MAFIDLLPYHIDEKLRHEGIYEKIKNWFIDESSEERSTELKCYCY